MRSFLYQFAGRKMFAPLPSDQVDARVLAATTAELHTIPDGARFVVFAASALFYAKFGTSLVAAAIPAADVTDGSAPEMNPEARQIPSGATHISLIAPAATIVTLSFYK